MGALDRSAQPHHPEPNLGGLHTSAGPQGHQAGPLTSQGCAWGGGKPEPGPLLSATCLKLQRTSLIPRAFCTAVPPKVASASAGQSRAAPSTADAWDTQLTNK